jgi:molybdopterin-binding protein
VRGTISAVYWYPTATVISVKTAEGAIVTREITPGAGSENQFLACILTAYSNGSEVLANVDGTNKYSYISME